MLRMIYLKWFWLHCMKYIDKYDRVIMFILAYFVVDQSIMKVISKIKIKYFKL